ncbi:MAG: hypothetical protein ACR2FU_09300 [Streptosporangiaceae bacterium]
MVRIDKWTYAIGTAAIAVAVVLGALAGKWPGALTGLAGIVSAALWQVAADRRKTVRADAAILADAEIHLVPTGPVPGGAAQYLRPETEVVNFRPRPELVILRDWIVSPSQTGIQLVTGEGGAGKTRLALQLSQETADQYGWRPYWIPDGREAQAVAAARQGQTPVLLIVDYAETRAALGDFLGAVAEDGAGLAIRVLLLARSAGEWWQQLTDSADTQLSETLVSRAGSFECYFF